jgi:hypothetical protein
MIENFPNATSGVFAEIRSYYPIPLFALNRYLTEFDRIRTLIAGFPKIITLLT